MSEMMDKVRAKLTRRVSHKDPEPNFDDEDAEADEETSSYVNKEVDDAEKDAERYPLGRPNSFLNRMISHGNKKTEDQIAQDLKAAEERERLKRNAVGSGQVMGAGQTTAASAQNTAPATASGTGPRT